MPRSMAGEVWDIIKVPFPYTNRPVQQHRLALVIGQHRAPGSPALVWLLMITSASHRRWTGDIGVSDGMAAGLPAPSMVRSAKIATVEALDAERIGYLPASDRPGVQGQLASLFASILQTR